MEHKWLSWVRRAPIFKLTDHRNPTLSKLRIRMDTDNKAAFMSQIQIQNDIDCQKDSRNSLIEAHRTSFYGEKRKKEISDEHCNPKTPKSDSRERVVSIVACVMWKREDGPRLWGSSTWPPLLSTPRQRPAETRATNSRSHSRHVQDRHGACIGSKPNSQTWDSFRFTLARWRPRSILTTPH